MCEAAYTLGAKRRSSGLGATLVCSEPFVDSSALNCGTCVLGRACAMVNEF